MTVPVSTDPMKVVEAFMHAMEKLDYDSALEWVHDDVVYTNFPLGLEAGTVIGPAGIRAVLEPFFAPTLTNEWVIKSSAVAGNTVFLERLDRHQFPKGWAELPVVGIFEVRDGLISSWREYFDWATITNGIAAVS